ncbi:MAG TPA: CD3324 family protein [Rectinemataceae bacterium]|nr:CD3324 family protein [Rectinemataceae bacterium]
MSYIKADDVLPSELLREVQKYVQGSLVYVPNPESGRRAWGERNGAREAFDRRNQEIREAKARGRRLEDLAEDYGLSVDAIRKVLYGDRRRARAR